jgi:SAM-dependent methyltransferase
MTISSATSALIAAASAPYRSTDRYAYYLACGKLRGDPAFTGILERGLLGACERILDLGCGQGLLASWLIAARLLHASHPWPAAWPAAPRPTSIRGIELKERDVLRARIALGAAAEFEIGDITEADFGTPDAIVILDVLHYIDYRAQEWVLRRAHSALAPGSLLLLRIGDADGGMRFALGKYVDQMVRLAYDYKSPKLYCRSARDWLSLLADGGFCTQIIPMSCGTPFANIMLVARRR